jgi:hypothetical protein
MAAAVSVQAGEASALGPEASKAGVGPLKYELPRQLRGSIYAVGTTQLLFRFKRDASRSGSRLNVTRGFTYPDGKLAARELVVYQGDALVSFQLEERQIGASGDAIIRRAPGDPTRGTMEFRYTSGPGEGNKVRTESLRENALVADMVGPFLKEHWAALEKAEKVKCRYVVIPRLETVGFTFVKDSESTWRGTPAVSVKMQPSSPFIAALVSPLLFTIEKAPPHRVLQYVGRTTPKLRVGDEWKDLDAVTVFDWSPSQ